MIGNAHIDPVWMWTWPAGADEAINTCRTACDLLDEYPDLTITRGEAWVYEQVRTLAPDLFERILKHIDVGRWSVVGGAWVQTDTNFPSRESFLKQFEIGQAWFQTQLKRRVTTGYQVDSFGHAAMIPAYLRANGITSYCFSRPTPSVLDLPAELFRWKAPTGEVVTAYRIPRSYCQRGLSDLKTSLEFTIKSANPALGHSMCFYGIGDHGGGPSRQQVEWILENRQYQDNVELRFSTLDTFFSAVEAAGLELPVVEGELRWVAPGCYSAIHGVKQQMRRAENLAAQAQTYMLQYPDRIPEGGEAQLSAAWQNIVFNAFHDILPGTSIEEAYEHARDELGAAKQAAREIIVRMTRQKTVSLPPCKRQRLVLHNISDQDFSGYVETEPWLGAEGDVLPVRYTNEDGKDIPLQMIPGHAAERKMFLGLMRAEIPAFGEQLIELHQDRWFTSKSKVSASATTVGNAGVQATVGPEGISALAMGPMSFIGSQGIRLSCFDDPSDTWSHTLPGCRYKGASKGTFRAETPWTILHDGPLRATLSNELYHKRCRLLWHVFVNADEPILRMRLRIIYSGAFEIAKLIIPTDFAPLKRIDGVSGCSQARPLDGQEYGFHNHVSLIGDERALALATRDAYAVDVEPEGNIRLTLLRSPHYTHDQFLPGGRPNTQRYPLTEQGEHVYDIALLPMAPFREGLLNEEVFRQTRPVWMSESTYGMPPRHHEGRAENRDTPTSKR